LEYTINWGERSLSNKICTNKKISYKSLIAKWFKYKGENNYIDYWYIGSNNVWKITGRKKTTNYYECNRFTWNEKSNKFNIILNLDSKTN
jgi:hypothetical protein